MTKENVRMYIASTGVEILAEELPGEKGTLGGDSVVVSWPFVMRRQEVPGEIKGTYNTVIQYIPLIQYGDNSRVELNRGLVFSSYVPDDEVIHNYESAIQSERQRRSGIVTPKKSQIVTLN